MRPLGIPIMEDRAKQALVKSALEPEWEAQFEPNSHGFRPGRSCHDAIESIFNSLRYKPKYILDADIKGCFDNIDHNKLLEKVNSFPKVRRQLRAWLKAGVIDGNTLSFSDSGTPQGGVISPLLANIALHGLEKRMKEYARTFKLGREGILSISLIRYADDFVLIHKDLNVVKYGRKLIIDFLKTMGLKLNEEKTKIVHSLNEHEGIAPGFDFLGFNVRQFKVGKCQSGKNGVGKLLGFKTIIKPAKKSIRTHYHRIAQIIDSHKSTNQEALVGKLSPIIRGWANYYKTKCSKDTFKLLNGLVFRKLWGWAKRRHTNKSSGWIKNKYWHTVRSSTWNFGYRRDNNDLTILQTHAEVAITRHTKVRGDASPYDGNINYWASRMGKHPEMSSTIARNLKIQKGKCNQCGLTFKPGDLLEIDHKVPRKAGGHRFKNNLQILHKHCHDTKTKSDLKVIKRYKGQQAWNKIQLKFNKHFEESKWMWIDDVPTQV